MMARCISVTVREQPDDLLRLAASALRKASGLALFGCAVRRARLFLLLGEPGAEEGQLSLAAVPPACQSHQPIASALQGSRTEIVGLEGKQQEKPKAYPAEQRLALVARAKRQFENSEAYQEDDQLEPHAVEEKPQRRDQEGNPREALLDEGKPVCAQGEVCRLAARLINGIDGQGASRCLQSMNRKPLELALGRGHAALLALIDGNGLTERLGERLIAGLGNMVAVLAV